MKVRTGFVSNSSSSSFVVLKKNISAADLETLLKYDGGDGWDFSQTLTEVSGYTNMDNGDLGDYLAKHGVDCSKIKWEGD